jgi:hypothetical protein
MQVKLEYYYIGKGSWRWRNWNHPVCISRKSPDFPLETQWTSECSVCIDVISNYQLRIYKHVDTETDYYLFTSKWKFPKWPLLLILEHEYCIILYVCNFIFKNYVSWNFGFQIKSMGSSFYLNDTTMYQKDTTRNLSFTTRIPQGYQKKQWGIPGVSNGQ